MIKYLYNLNKVKAAIILVHLICLVLGEGLVGYFLIFSMFLLTSISLLKNDYVPLYLMLLLGSYHSEYNSIYNSGILGVNFIYLLLVLYSIMSLMSVSIPKKATVFILGFIILYIINSTLGYYYRYSFEWYFNEWMSFTFFLIFIISTASLKKEKLHQALRILMNYVLFYYPILTLISIVFSTGENLYFDEFEKFYYVSIIPIFLIKMRYKSILVLFHLLIFILKSQYTYTSSLNIILVACSATTLFVLGNFGFIKKLFFVFLISISSLIVYQYSSPLTKFKVFQAGEAISRIIKGDVLSIPKSPRVRVLEFMISFQNLKNDGILLPFIGKGYGSYIDDSETKYFRKYSTELNDDDYSKEEVSSLKFKKGHGGIPYMPIKIGILGMLLFLGVAIIAISLIRNKEIGWLGISGPFYIITTFSYGLKNFIFVGLIIGLILAIRFGNKYDNNERKTLRC